MVDQNIIQIGAESRSANAFGADYLSEIRRVIDAHAHGNSHTVLEWGMGNSTRFFLEERDALHLAALYSIDHHAEYFAALEKTLPKWDCFYAFRLDLIGQMASDRDAGLNYSTFPLSLPTRFDVIYIDGRRRMECALAAAQLCSAHTIVFLHDYRRERYQGVRFLFDIVEDGPQFRVMKLKPQLLAARPVK